MVKMVEYARMMHAAQLPPHLLAQDVTHRQLILAAEALWQGGRAASSQEEVEHTAAAEGSNTQANVTGLRPMNAPPGEEDDPEDASQDASHEGSEHTPKPEE